MKFNPKKIFNTSTSWVLIHVEDINNSAVNVKVECKNDEEQGLQLLALWLLHDKINFDKIKAIMHNLEQPLSNYSKNN